MDITFNEITKAEEILSQFHTALDTGLRDDLLVGLLVASREMRQLAASMMATLTADQLQRLIVRF